MTLGTNPINPTELRTEFDALTPNLTQDKQAGANDYEVNLRLGSLASTATLMQRSLAWTQPDDADLQALILRVEAAGAIRVVVARLTVDGIADAETDRERAAFAKYLGGNESIDLTVTTGGAAVEDRDDYANPEGTPVRLLRGVRYRIEMENTTGASTVSAVLQFIAQMRGVRRGGNRGPALVPHAFRAGNLDVEKVNENLQAIADDVKATQDRRHSIGVMIFDLSGLVDTDTAALWQIPLRQATPTAGDGRPFEVVGVELVVSEVTGADMHLILMNNNDALWPAVEVDTDGTNEVYASSGVPFRVDDDTDDTVLEIIPDTAAGNTITRGYVVVHTRSDRWQQDDAVYAPPEPTLLNSVSDTDAATLQAELTALADALDASEAADVDQRPRVFVGRAIAGTSKAFRIPGGEMHPTRVRAYAVVAATSTARVTVATPGSTVTVDVVGAGATARATGTAALNDDAGDDPTDSADDTIVTLSRQAGADTILLLVAVLYFD